MAPRSPFIYSFHMPLFFLISGFLYKDSSFSELLNGKLKRLIIPFFFFSLGSWAVYFLKVINDLELYLPYALSIFRTLAGWNLDNGNLPLWFLACLFSTTLLYWIVRKLTDNIVYSSIIIFLLSLVGYYTYKAHIEYLPFRLEVACTAIVFYHIGHCLKKYDLLSQLKNIKLNWLIVLLCISIPLQFLLIQLNTELSGQDRINMFSNSLGNYFVLYPCAILGVFSLISVCLKIEKIDILNWYGKNSLIILALHYPITSQSPNLSRIVPASFGIYTKSFVAAIITMAICYPFILFLKKYFPVLTGYKTFTFSGKNTTNTKSVMAEID